MTVFSIKKLLFVWCFKKNDYLCTRIFEEIANIKISNTPKKGVNNYERNTSSRGSEKKIPQ